MDIVETGKKIFKKGIKIPLFKIPLTKPKPKVEHNIQQEFNRERTLEVLGNVRDYFVISLPHAPEFEKAKMSALLQEIDNLIEFINAYK